MLLASRMLQAVGCGMLLSFAQVVLLRLYPKERHGTIMGAYAMAATTSSLVAPTYAGLMLDFIGWRGVFASLFGVTVVVAAAVILYLRSAARREALARPA